MATFADLLLLLRADTSDIDNKLKATRKELSTFGSQAASFGASLSNFGTQLTGALTVPLVGIGAASLKLAGDLEQNRVAFQTLLGSADAARIHLEQLRDFAQRTPFEFTDLVTASKRLQALGFTAGEVIPTLTAVGNATAALGTGAQGIERVTLAIGQILAKGTVQAQEMKQLAEAGIPAWQILAKTLNTDVKGAMDLVEKRAVDAGTAVPAILAGINERFSGLMQAQNKMLLGQFSNLKDRVVQVLSEIGDAMAPTAKRVVDFGFQVASKIEEMTSAFNRLPQPLKDAAVGLAAFAAAAGPAIFIGGQMVSAVGNLAKAFAALIPYLVSAGLPAGFSGIAAAAGIAGAAIAALVVIGPKLIALAGNVKDLIVAFGQLGPIRAFVDTVSLIGRAIESQIPVFSKIRAAVAEGFQWQDLLGPLSRFLDTINSGLNSLVDKTGGMGAAIASNLKRLNVAAEETSKSWEDNLARKAAAAVQALRDRAEEAAKALKEAFSALDVKNVSAETDKLQKAFSVLQAGARAGTVSSDELAAATENLRIKIVELREGVNQAPLKALGVTETVAGLNIAIETLDILNERLLAGKQNPVEYAQAFATVAEKLQKFKQIQDDLLTKPFADMLAEGNKKLLEQIALVQALGDADKAVADGALDDLTKKQQDFAESLNTSAFSIRTADGILRSFGQKTAAEAAENIEMLRRKLDDANAAMRVGVPGAARAAIIAANQLSEALAEAANPEPFRQLGIQSQASLRTLADRARANFQQIKADGQSTTFDIQRAWLKMIEAQIAAGEKLPKETLNQYEQIKNTVGGTTRAVDNAWKQMSRQISTIVTDLSRGIADAIVNFKSLGDVAVSVVKDIATAILRTLIEGAIKKLANEMAGLPGIIGSIGKAFGGVAEQVKSATTAVTDLSKVITGAGGVLGTTVGATGGVPSIGGIPGLPNGGIGSPGDFPKIPGPAGTGGIAGAAGSVAGSSLSGIVGAVAGVVEAISSVIANFQLARQEGTLNAIEQHTKVTAIAIAGISAPWEKVADGQDTLFFKVGDIKNLLSDLKAFGFEFLLPTLSDMKDSISALAAGSLAFLASSASSSDAQASAVAIAQALLESAKSNNASVQAQLVAVKTAVLDGAKGISGAIESQTRQLHGEFVTLADNIYKSINPLGVIGTILGSIGGGLGALGGGIGQAGSSLLGAAAGGVGNLLGAAASAFGTREEGTLNAIEQHTKVMSIALLGISAPWETVKAGQDTLFNRIGDMRNVLSDIKAFNFEVLHADLVRLTERVSWPSFAVERVIPAVDAIRDYLTSTKSASVTSKQATAPAGTYDVTFNIYETSNAQDTAREVAAHLKTLIGLPAV